MGLLSWQLLVLGAAELLLGHCSGSSSHNLSLFYIWVSKPNQELPEFMAVQSVDDQNITYYDSSIKQVLARGKWIGKAEKNDVQFWDSNSKAMQHFEKIFKTNLTDLQKSFNQSDGFHIWQGVHGCELSEDGQKWGYWKSAYDGRDVISFDTKSITWMVADAAAEKMKRKWDALLTMSQIMKHYLEGPCIDWMKKFVAYGSESLLRKEVPVVKVAYRVYPNGEQALICRAFGFYPKKIYMTWWKDEAAWGWNVSHGGVLPNSDGTYHSWIKVLIDPNEKANYQCHVKLDGNSELSLIEGFREKKI